MSVADLKGWRSEHLADVKVWLSETDDIDQVVAAAEHLLKLLPATGNRSTRSPHLLDLEESIRRSERRVAELMRAGQAAGLIKKNGREKEGRRPGHIANRHFLHWCYIVFDGVDPERFEAALIEARQQRSMSRTTVEDILHSERIALRKATRPREWVPVATRLEQIRSLANTGHRSNQIGQMLGVTPEHVRRLAFENGIVLHDARHGSRAIDANRVMNESVGTLEGVAMAVGLIDTDDLDPERVGGWSASLKESIRTLQHLHKELTR